MRTPLLHLLVFLFSSVTLVGQCPYDSQKINADHWSYLKEHQLKPITSPFFSIEASKHGFMYGTAFEIIQIKEGQFQFQILPSGKWGNLKKQLLVSVYECSQGNLKNIYSKKETIHKPKGKQPQRINVQVFNVDTSNQYYVFVAGFKDCKTYTVRTAQSFRQIESRSTSLAQKVKIETQKIIGRITDDNGGMLASVNVTLLNSEKAILSEVLSNSEGEFRFENLVNGQGMFVKLDQTELDVNLDMYLFDDRGMLIQRAASLGNNLFGFVKKSHSYSDLRLLSRADYSIFPSQNKVGVVGRIVDKSTHLYGRENVEIALLDNENQEIKSTKSNKKGNFFFSELDEAKYSVKIKDLDKESYAEMVLVDADNTPIESANSDGMGADGTFRFNKLPVEEVKLQRLLEQEFQREVTDFTLLESQDVVILKNVFFETGKTDLLMSSYSELLELTEYLTENSESKIEVSGHTDNVGGAALNQRLSEDRAKSVHDYLIEHGIDSNRLSFKGYGKSQHIAPNLSEKGMRQNRRVEIRVLK